MPIAEVEFGFLTNHEFVPLKRVPAPKKKRTIFLGEEVFQPYYFEVDLEVIPNLRVRPAIRYGGRTYRPKVTFVKNAGLVDSPSGYKILKSFIVQNVKNKYFAVKPRTVREIWRREFSLLRTIVNDKRTKGIQRKKSILLCYRILSLILITLKRKQIWLISDRFSSAGDNGEAFFRYMASNTNRNRKVIFLQSKDSAEYQNLRKVGNVVEPDSFVGRLLYLVADVFASSQADDHILNPFGADSRIMRDNYRFEFVFLQHGVTINDISDWLNAFDKPLARFVVCGQTELNEVTKGNYGLDSVEVPVLGFPRHDRLVNNKNTKRIVVAPTWRSQLAGQFDRSTNTRHYREDFKDSDYFQFYQQLLSSETLNKALEREGYVLDFVLHPNFSPQNIDFVPGEFTNIVVPPYDYKTLISNSEIFVTDYSSVVADAAYLRKKIAYIQFDDLVNRGGHTVAYGDFDFVEDGFGPVFYDLQSLIGFLVNSMVGSAQDIDKYEPRIQRVFKFRDFNNSERVSQEIEQLLK
ncbi:CDP-glycerol glycerophosphotransferase family protein [Corynebacterium renale]|uniref:CDP-glycerol glycerophosphotransferase family protein n=1 Tax=Corynebacterium renale TaxID=1724 RepID=UPI000654845F|nr:CDP-glycerol glycerophosphotransferase family protein [Corynebacterium renale]